VAHDDRNPAYEAIECKTAPKPGRSGGGLFTTDGYLAGVCNFAEPQGNHGLYATPRSIYSLLDRNHLATLYAPVGRGSGTLVADGRSPSQPGRTATPIARSQSPDRDEPEPGRAGAAQGAVMLPPPHPSLLGIADPVAAAENRTPQAAAGTTRRIAWHPTPRAASHEARSPQPAEPTELDLDPAADHDRFGPPPAEWRIPSSGTHRPGVNPPPNPDSAVQVPAKSRWRAVKATPADPGSETGGE
jgi:hypothetical protein